jgi:asparagine synthase (glutamine-hydrolysing)
MCHRMSCRGPDGSGTWLGGDGRVALGHLRLAVIDLSERGAQPMASADGTCVITFNGEIYNYRALRTALEAKGYRFRSDSDTEVLLHLYADKGEAMVHELRGMFAFALWDGQRKTLFLARDPFGIKPLYFSDDGRCFRAASEVKALLAGGGIDTRPEPAGHVGFFLWGHVPEPYTLYKGIQALPAGSTLLVEEHGRRAVRKYADITQMLSRAESEPLPLGTKEVGEQLRAALLDTVQHHLVADVEVGVFLSAGLDSTTLAALAAEVGGKLRTVTLGFREYRGTAHDETRLAELVARQHGAQHHTVWITREEFHRELERLLDRMDQPTIDGVNSFFVARAAAEAGLKVAISGLGGDELFGSYPSFRDIPRLVSVLRYFPASSTVGRGVRVVSAPLLKRLTSPKYAGLIEYGGDYAGAYLLRRGLFLPWELPAVLDPELVRDGLRELRARAGLHNTVSGISVARLKVTALEAAWYMRNQLLRDTDWASMTHSLEVRVPLVDWTLWRRVAPLVRVAPSLDKRAMARSPKVPLPDPVLGRRKTGFTVPTRDWLAGREHGGRYGQRGLRGWARYVYDRAG